MTTTRGVGPSFAPGDAAVISTVNSRSRARAGIRQDRHVQDPEAVAFDERLHAALGSAVVAAGARGSLDQPPVHVHGALHAAQVTHRDRGDDGALADDHAGRVEEDHSRRTDRHVSLCRRLRDFGRGGCRHRRPGRPWRPAGGGGAASSLGAGAGGTGFSAWVLNRPIRMPSRSARPAAMAASQVSLARRGTGAATGAGATHAEAWAAGGGCAGATAARMGPGGFATGSSRSARSKSAMAGRPARAGSSAAARTAQRASSSPATGCGARPSRSAASAPWRPYGCTPASIS